MPNSNEFVYVMPASLRPIGVRSRRPWPPTVSAHLIAQHLALDLRGRRSGRERRADERTHARARDAVDGDSQLVEHPQHADVRSAFGAAAAENEADPRTPR